MASPGLRATADPAPQIAAHDTRGMPARLRRGPRERGSAVRVERHQERAPPPTCLNAARVHRAVPDGQGLDGGVGTAVSRQKRAGAGI